MGSRITAREVAALRPTNKLQRIEVDTGLQLRIPANGEKTWVVRYSIDGKERSYRLPKPFGIATDAGHMSLADARIEAAAIRASARVGIDVKAQLEAAKLAQLKQFEKAAQADTSAAEREHQDMLRMQDIFDAWIADGVRRKDDNAELKRSFNANVLGELGECKVNEITEHHLRAILRAIVARGANRAAVMMCDNLTQMFKWAEKRQPWRKLLADGNPMDLIEIDKIVHPSYDIDNRRDRILSADEIVELATIFRKKRADYESAPNKRIVPQPIEATTRIAVWIMLSTLCRVGELSMARWEHVDLPNGIWRIPKANVKGSVALHIVYLSEFSRSCFRLLDQITGCTAWCFPSHDGEHHVDVKSISKQIGDRQMQFKKMPPGKSRKPLKNRRQDNSLVLSRGARGAWTPTDLRRTGATMMQALGVPLDTIDRCQNHVLPGSKVRRHYLHHDYASEKKEAWGLLGDRLSKMLEQHMDSILLL